MFSDYMNITYRPNLLVQADSFSLAWGTELLRRLKLEGMSPFDKARKLNACVYSKFNYTGSRQFELADIIRHKGGNCVAHANLGVFLLRLAGIQAKYAHEMHVLKKSIYSRIIGFNTRKANEGINGDAHNDHVWVWFLNAEGDWLPFDSALGYVGFDELFQKRVFDRKRHCRSYIEKRTGPPFFIWEDIGRGLADMKNVSREFWSRMPPGETSIAASDWIALASRFDGWEKQDFYKACLPPDLDRDIKVMAARMFGK